MPDEIIPLRGIPVATTVDGVTVRGEITALYPNDITVVVTEPVSGLSSGVHIPYFAMGHRSVATSDNRRTTDITPYGEETAAWLLRQLYDYARGKQGGWPVDTLTPDG